MPVHYNINAELKLVIYICRGVVSGRDIIQASDQVYLDKRRVPGLVTIIDFLSAVDDIQLGELKEAIQRIEISTERGLMRGPIVVLSYSKGIQILMDTINLLPHKLSFQIVVVDTLDAAIASLGLLESRDEIIRFWQESQLLLE